MHIRRVAAFASLLLFALCWLKVRPTSAGDDWQPISQEDLKATSDPAAPGAPAIILYRQVDRDDSSSHTPHEFNYVRAKIFTEEGRKYGDVDIPFFKSQSNVTAIRARTIRPDGTIVNFDGKVFEKEIVKARGLKYLAKTFTLPDVQPGCIIEYRYTIDFTEGYVYSSHWTLSEELFTRYAKFSLKPSPDFALQWSWPNGLPTGTNPPAKQGSTINLESRNIPAFQVEDDMPPEDVMKSMVDFIYSDDGFEKEPDKFWKKRGKKLNETVEGFVGKKKAMEQAVAQIVSPSDSPEVKAQKIYARVQQLRNTSYEVEKTEQEQKREKEASNVEDLWKRGYGSGVQLTWLYLGLTRAAGLEAYPAMISARNENFFNSNIMRASDLNANVVLLKLNGKDVYLDPGAAFAPYGMLPWAETGVKGLKLDKDGGSWITTTMPESSESQIVRKADLKLTPEGSLEGKLTVTYSGHEAYWRRVEERHEDATTLKKFLEDDVRASIPVGIDVELTNQPDWKSSAPTMVAQFDIKVPGWVSGAGRHAIMPVGLFGGPEKHICEHTSRVHPLYFHYPSQKADDITIDLPLGWSVSTVPQPLKNEVNVVAYTLKVEDKKGALHLERRVRSDLISLEAKYYNALRNFYQSVRTADEQQIVLQPVGSSASN